MDQGWWTGKGDQRWQMLHAASGRGHSTACTLYRQRCGARGTLRVCLCAECRLLVFFYEPGVGYNFSSGGASCLPLPTFAEPAGRDGTSGSADTRSPALCSGEPALLPAEVWARTLSLRLPSCSAEPGRPWEGCHPRQHLFVGLSVTGTGVIKYTGTGMHFFF